MSVVKLFYSGGTYGNWELNPGRLLCLDNVESYLTRKSCITLSTIQYQKLELEHTLKLDLTQSYAVPKAGTSFKYVSIQNTGEAIHYYFIKKITWRSKSAVELELVLDVLNTFKEGTDYDFKPSTNIIREHKSRFKVGPHEVTFAYEEIEDRNGWFYGGESVYWTDDLDPGENFHGTLVSIDEHGFVIKFDADWTQKDFERWYENTARPYLTDGEHWIWFHLPKIMDVVDEWLRNVDYIPEGINPILQKGSESSTDIVDAFPLGRDWYLLYRNQSEPDAAHQFINPVDCYLIPGDWLSVKVSSITAGKMNSNSLELGKYYMIKLLGAGLANVFTLDDGTDIGATDLVSDVVFIVIYKTSNDRIAVSKSRGNLYDTSHGMHPSGFWETKTIQINHLPLSYSKVDSIPDTDSYATWQQTYADGDSGLWTSGDINVITDDITDLDRTDSRNIKCIKLPYCPYKFTITGGMIDISADDNWEYGLFQNGEGTLAALKLIKDVKLENEITGNASPLAYLKIFDMPTPAKDDVRVTSWVDPKLLMSEFRKEVYFYDSFEYDIALEKVNLDWYLDNDFDLSEFKITFTMTKTINSKFMFSFKDIHMRLCESNLPIVMPIARNNEEVLYNVPYINYIRTGFNYDVKAKNLQVASNVAGLALAGTSLVASLLLPSIPLKVAGVVGSIVSFASSVKSAIVSAKSAENNIERKLEETKRQTDSVAGSDDVDLMSEYCGNRLKSTSYQPNTVMKSYLNDLFFYAGYRSDRMGLPNHMTRINFDYLECTPQFENIRSIPSECLIELANCFKSGVTYMHYNSNLTAKYDFDQSHENWERFLFDD